MSAGESCGTCKFAQLPQRIALANAAPQANPTCQRFPPVGYPVPNGAGGFAGIGVFPPVSIEAWCGEYQPRDPH
jgi:hypothetical protein